MGHVAGVNFFLKSQSRLDMCWGTSRRSLPSSGRDVTVRELFTQWPWSTTLFKIEFVSKTSFGVKFFGFFTPIFLPSLC